MSDTWEHLELLIEGARERVPLRASGSPWAQAATNPSHCPWDRTVSRVHAVLERVASRRCVRDLASRNGTFVNEERIWGDVAHMERNETYDANDWPEVDATRLPQ